MDQLYFIYTTIQEIETQYNARVLYEMYKQFHRKGNYGVAISEPVFFKKLKNVDGVTWHRFNSGVVYHFNKKIMKKHLEVVLPDILEYMQAKNKNLEEERLLKEEKLLIQHREQKRLQEEEEDRKLKNIEEQEALCRKLIVEYAYSDSLTRLSIEPSLFLMLESRFADEGKRNEFIKSIATAAAKPTVEYVGVYVLRLEGLPHTHYVGCSKTVLARIEQHRRGAGAACTAGATSIEVLPLLTLPLKEGDDIDLDSWERAETLTLMYTIGIDKVRGWHYVKREHSDDDRRSIHHNICSRNGLCLRCGFGSHMVTNCFARYRSLWMGGGAL